MAKRSCRRRCLSHWPVPPSHAVLAATHAPYNGLMRARCLPSGPVFARQAGCRSPRPPVFLARHRPVIGMAWRLHLWVDGSRQPR
jgi:hypothetical protein